MKKLCFVLVLLGFGLMFFSLFFQTMDIKYNLIIFGTGSVIVIVSHVKLFSLRKRAKKTKKDFNLVSYFEHEILDPKNTDQDIMDCFTLFFSEKKNEEDEKSEKEVCELIKKHRPQIEKKIEEKMNAFASGFFGD